MSVERPVFRSSYVRGSRENSVGEQVGRPTDRPKVIYYRVGKATPTGYVWAKWNSFKSWPAVILIRTFRVEEINVCIPIAKCTSNGKFCGANCLPLGNVAAAAVPVIFPSCSILADCVERDGGGDKLRFTVFGMKVSSFECSCGGGGGTTDVNERPYGAFKSSSSCD